MADWSNEKARRCVNIYSEMLRPDWTMTGTLFVSSGRLNRHAEKVNTWIVGLSTGAIVLLVTGFSKLPNIPRGQAVMVFAPFLFSIISGLLLRWLLKETERSLQSRCWS
jgi:predicted alpha/beta-fold hydrolase